MYTQRSFVLKPQDARKKWHLLDAKGEVLGRIASKVANLLRGKGNPQYTPHTDSGDFVVVINAKKVKLTGQKLSDKKYHSHSGYVGGLKVKCAKEYLEKRPEFILYHAVKGMLPKNSLGRKQLTKLKIFADSEHTHTAQNPQHLNSTTT